MTTLRPTATASRRQFLRQTLLGLAAANLASTWLPAATPFPALVVDTHTHFYDPTRAQGVPWPPKDDAVLYRTILPKNYQSLPKPQSVTGTIVVEASSWIEDNQWILDLAEKNPFILGFVGHLPVGTQEFRPLLTKFGGKRLFRGLRLTSETLRPGLDQPRFLADLKLLAERELSLDVVGGSDLLPSVAKLAKLVPSLRIVIDHLAGVKIDGQEPETTWTQALRQAAEGANVFLKISGLVEGSGQKDNKAPRQTSFYRPVLDTAWNVFGPTRLLYGSNWPVCEHFADLATVQRIVLEYLVPKGREALDNIFAANSQRAYKWTRRV